MSLIFRIDFIKLQISDRIDLKIQNSIFRLTSIGQFLKFKLKSLQRVLDLVCALHSFYKFAKRMFIYSSIETVTN